MPVEPRRHLAALRPAFHGGISAAEAAAHGRSIDQILDFSVSTNPLGPSPQAITALQRIDPARYPDDAATELRRELAAREGLPEDRFLVGNGSSELIWLAAQAYLESGDQALIVGPTYGEYARAVRQAAAEPIEWRANPDDDFLIDCTAVARLTHQIQPKASFLCNPNNPTGRHLDSVDLLRLSESLPNTLVAIDEAYRPFVVDAAPTAGLADRPNVLLIRSLTKDCGLAGLRLGYAVASPAIIRSLAGLRPPWSVNAAAQAAGLAGLRDAEHRRRSLAATSDAKACLVEGLTELGYQPVPSAANFVLVPVGDGAAMRSRLLQAGICVRDCASFGLPAYVRIGVRPIAECRQLLAALERVTSRGSRVTSYRSPATSHGSPATSQEP